MSAESPAATGRFSLDTNILVYAVDCDAGARREIAAEIVARSAERDCRLTLQALSEFYALVTRKSRMSRTEAAAQIEDWLVLFPTLNASAAAVRAALEAATAGAASYWDALLAATAAEGGCAVLLSEDMRGGGRLGSIRIVDPFDGEVMAEEARRLLS